MTSKRECYKELCQEVQNEVSKASQLLGFLGILIFVGLGKLTEVSVNIKIIVFILMLCSLTSLLYTILGRGYLGLPDKLEKTEMHYNEKHLKDHYNKAYSIWKQKHKLNFISFSLLILTFLVVVFSLFFL